MSDEWVPEAVTVYQMRCSGCRNMAGPPLRSMKAVERWLEQRTKACRYCEPTQRAVDRQKVFTAALEVYTEEGVMVWMDSKNRLLDDRSPNDLINKGETRRVLDYIDFLAEGNFA